MPHYHLQALAGEWDLVRETPSSQVYNGKTKYRDLPFTANIHFTAPPIATVALVFIGKREQFTDGVIQEIFDDLSIIVLRRNRYAVIDYSVAYASKLSDGNFSILEEERKGYSNLYN